MRTINRLFNRTFNRTLNRTLNRSGRPTASRFAPRAASLGLLPWLLWAGCSGEMAIAGDDPDRMQTPDGGPRIQSQDSLPAGAVSFFNRKTCPVGWEAYALAAGRTVVPSIGRDPVGNTQGDPLSDSEERKHSHQLSGSVSTDSVSYIGIAGEANHGVARSGTYPLSLSSEPAASNLPYLQLLICRKSGAPNPQKAPPPVGTLLFFAASACPQGWTQPALSQGRFLVGLPEGAKSGLAFGAPSLTTTEARAHRHGGKGSIQTGSHGIALASGSGAGGYVRNDRYAFSVMSTTSIVDLPYVQLLQCQKQ